MSTTTTPAELLRNKTQRRYGAPPHTNYSDRRLPDRDGKKVRSGLVSRATRNSRRMRAHLRVAAHIGGKAKHLHVSELTSGDPRMAPKKHPLDGNPRGFAPHAERKVQEVYEFRCTAPLPWVVRQKRRAANRRARASRKANR